MQSEAQLEGSEAQLEGSEAQLEGSETPLEGFEAQLKGSDRQPRDGQMNGQKISPFYKTLSLPEPLPKKKKSMCRGTLLQEISWDWPNFPHRLEIPDS